MLRKQCLLSEITLIEVGLILLKLEWFYGLGVAFRLRKKLFFVKLIKKVALVHDTHLVCGF